MSSLTATYASSSNWAGYVSDTSTTAHPVQEAQGLYNVNQVCSICTDVASFVGVGGWASNGNLAQTGVSHKYMSAFWELYPAGAAHFMFPVNNFDQIFSDVGYDADTKAWFLYVGD